MTYEVQTRMVNVWENCWTDDNGPLTFATKSEAQAEIDELMREMPDYLPSDYRIVQRGAV